MNSPIQELYIEANSSHKQYFRDLFRFRELFYFLAWRDVVVRYKQTALGVVWALIRPLLTMGVFAFVFGRVAHLAPEGESYPLFVLAALLPWALFSGSLIDTSLSLVNNAPMISKVYFPRLILPASHLAVHFVDFLISLSMLLALLAFKGTWSLSLLALPLMIALTLLLALGTGLWLSAASVRYRDFRFIIPFIVQFGLFLCPVGYSAFVLPEAVQPWYFLNPMVGIIEGFRWCCFSVYTPGLFLALTISCVMTAALLYTGFYFFRKVERVCADIL